MCCRRKWLLGGGTFFLAGLTLFVVWTLTAQRQQAVGAAEAARAVTEKAKESVRDEDHESCLPNESWKMPFKDEIPIVLVARGANPAAWDALRSFWNEDTEKVVDPRTGEPIVRKVVKLKLPLGLNTPPSVPGENPMTVQKWKLGKSLFFDRVLSSDHTISCSTCHQPTKGYTDQRPASVGIRGQKGGISAPTIFNVSYNTLLFWDGRARSLEDQSQGPPQNAMEMFDGSGHAWRKVVDRVRGQTDLVQQFKQVFGTVPTRDTVAKAIACYERTVFSGNSIHDRAEQAMRQRVEKDESGTAKLELTVQDYLGVVKAAFARKDTVALKALELDAEGDAGKADETAKRLLAGRNLFFGKARCNSCHVGDNFNDGTFHNLGIEARDGHLPERVAGRYGAQAPGHKNPEFFGSFKTPTLRHLTATAPYMHDGSLKSLEEVVDFYDRGGNVNAFLDVKMRDENAERAWYKARAEGKDYRGPEVKVYDGKAIVPLKLNLTKQEKADVVLFLRSLQGDDPDPIVANPKLMPK
jgi:cytochrome c peroxidase